MSLGETKFTCRVELSKKNGIAITIKDLSQPTQVYKQVLLEGETLTIKTVNAQSSSTITQTDEKITSEVKTSNGKTTIEQGPEEIKVTCKLFTVVAETVSVKSSKDSKHEATGTFTVESTKDLSLDSKAKFDIKSTGAMTLDATAAATFKSAASMSSQAPKIEITADASIDAKSSGALNLKGSAVSIKGDMRAELDSPSTTVGSTMTTVKGQVVSVTGAMIKLG
ncbi:MAG: hypothetical protein RJA70_1070 [Pseudomonadota bacterium]|jgi:hypothetical protein